MKKDVLIEMKTHSEHTLLTEDNYFEGIEYCFQPWEKYMCTDALSLKLDKSALKERVEMLKGSIYFWNGFGSEYDKN